MRKFAVFGAILAFVLCVLSMFTLVPVSKKVQESAVVSIDERRFVELLLPDSQILYVRPQMGADSLLSVHLNDWTASIYYHQSGFFVGGDGEIQTFVPDSASLLVSCDSSKVNALLQREASRLASRLAALDSHKKEIAYYLRTRNVADEGYSLVTDLSERIQRETQRVDSLYALVQLALKSSAVEATLVRQVFVNDTLCLPTDDASRWQLASKCLPSNRYAFNLKQLRWWSGVRDTLLVTDGSPVIDGHGAVRGVYTKHGVVPVGGFGFSVSSWWRSVCQWFRCMFGSFRDQAVPYKERTGISQCDTLGASYIGEWHGDTLTSGWALCGDTVYCGAFDDSLRYAGEGILMTTETCYSGEWSDGVRSGMGVNLAPGKIVYCGRWKNDSFVGEKMIYTNERVYGIDISRYQHEIKRKRYSINWNSMRIISLGKRHANNVIGRADFPVSFCYIKATQGIRIKSRYYAQDAKDARRHGVAVGAYHFFAPASGVTQANFFMSVASPRVGDLPPMLDVELTDKQIRGMGGAEAMCREMLAWLKVVGQRTGTKPVIYVSQNFVNKYLYDAPRELQDYPIWIARYSEYRPFVRLQFWQLSADGKVAGIHGDVDIDVFNGSHEQFQEFVRESCVRK